MCFFNITLDNKNYLQYTSFRRVFRVNDMGLAQTFVKDRISLPIFIPSTSARFGTKGRYIHIYAQKKLKTI